VVGARGFEPRTSCAQGRRATRLRYAPTESSFYSSLLCECVATAPRLDRPTSLSDPRNSFALCRNDVLVGRGLRLKPAGILPVDGVQISSDAESLCQGLACKSNQLLCNQQANRDSDEREPCTAFGRNLHRPLGFKAFTRKSSPLVVYWTPACKQSLNPHGAGINFNPLSR
jgi:hypothetical protein